MRLLGLVAFTACATPPAYTYTLKQQAMIIGARPIAGIDSDGAGGLWIVYRDPVGGYYDPDDVRVDHLDAQGNQLSEWLYQDEFTPVTGLAYSGDALWVSYNEYSSGNNHLRKLDPATGATLGTFATEPGIEDISWRPGALLLSNEWSGIVALDPATGGEQWRAFTPITDSTQRGIAADGARTWVISWTELDLVDDSGSAVATAYCPLLPVDGGDPGLQLAWDGSELILEIQNRVVWFALEKAGS